MHPIVNYDRSTSSLNLTPRLKIGPGVDLKDRIR